MSWLLGRRSQLSLSSKILRYKCVLKPVWTYGIQLWGCANPSHTQILQRFQSKLLRTLANAPWYVFKLQLHQTSAYHLSEQKSADHPSFTTAD